MNPLTEKIVEAVKASDCILIEYKKYDDTPYPYLDDRVLYEVIDKAIGEQVKQPQIDLVEVERLVKSNTRFIELRSVDNENKEADRAHLRKRIGYTLADVNPPKTEADEYRKG